MNLATCRCAAGTQKMTANVRPSSGSIAMGAAEGLPESVTEK